MLFRASTKRVTLLRFYGANLSGFSTIATIRGKVWYKASEVEEFLKKKGKI
jgi:hypothetical protein